ncbi:MAG: Crp/Fnr family transcriptional regulator [Arcobacteraceae bacterium]
MIEEHLKKIFISFTDEMIKQLADISTVKKYKKDNILFYEGDKPKVLYIIIEGVASVYKTYEDFSIQVLKYFYPTNIIAELANVQNIPYPASLRCEEDSTFIIIDYTLFKKTFSTNALSASLANECLLKTIGDKLFFHINENNLRPMKNLSIIQRISAQLLQDLDYFNRTKRWKVAQDLCISSETLSRILNKLKTVEAIAINRGKISILNDAVVECIAQYDFDMNQINKLTKTNDDK